MAGIEDYVYSFDATGTAPANKVVGEPQIISPPNFKDFYCVVPDFAPFFRESLTVVHSPSGRTLLEGEDFDFTHHFSDASLKTAKPIYGSITLFDKTLSGVLTFTYQTVGGAWTLNTSKIEEILSDALLNPRVTTWDQVTEYPISFPPIDHEWDAIDLIGMSDVTEKLNAIKDAILVTNEGGLYIHVSDLDNPHQVTKQQVNLGNVEDFGIATEQDSVLGTSNEKYMTPLRVRQAMDGIVLGPITQHLVNTNNPHGVTKDQVGLGSVQNYAIAAQVDAEQGISNSLYMTPQRVKQAIDAMALGQFNSHATNADNPHNTTKAHVGLGSVENFGVASETQAVEGTISNAYMTPLRVKQAVTALVLTAFNTHASNTSNPHQVNKEQVGLGSVEDFAVATQEEATTGTANDRYMTPLRVKEAIDAFAGASGFSTHVNNEENPHNVTKSQVGLSNVENYSVASIGEARNGAVTNKYMTPVLTAEAIAYIVGDAFAAHASDQDNPHGVTIDQLGGYSTDQIDTLISGRLASTGTATNSTRLAGYELEELRTYILSGTVNNSSRLEGQSLQQVLTSARNGRTANSAALDGQSLAQLRASWAGQRLFEDSQNSDAVAYRRIAVVAMPTEPEPLPEPVVDELWDFTVAAVGFNGTLIDARNGLWSINGNANVQLEVGYFEGDALYLPGNADDSVQLDGIEPIGLQDFAVETRLLLPELPGVGEPGVLLELGSAKVYVDDDGKLKLAISDVDVVESDVLVIDTEYDVTLVRSDMATAGVIALYLDGSPVGTAQNFADDLLGTSLILGTANDGSDGLACYIGGIRLTMGVPRFTEAYTLAELPYPEQGPIDPGEIPVPDVPSWPDVVLMVAGGESVGSADSTVHMLRASIRETGTVEVVRVMGSDMFDSEFAYRLSDDELQMEIWLKGAINYGSFTVTELSKGNASLVYSEPAVDVEPTNIQYLVAKTAWNSGNFDPDSKLDAGATAVDSEKLEGKSLAEVMTDVGSATVENANNLGGTPAADYATVAAMNQLRTDLETAIQALTDAFNDAHPG